MSRKVFERFVKTEKSAHQKESLHIPRPGTRVKFDPNPASLMMYSGQYKLPKHGEEGIVVEVSGIPSGRSHYLKGPGGGLVYVKWDSAGTLGVAPVDIVKTGSLEKQAEIVIDRAEMNVRKAFEQALKISSSRSKKLREMIYRDIDQAGFLIDRTKSGILFDKIDLFIKDALSDDLIED